MSVRGLLLSCCGASALLALAVADPAAAADQSQSLTLQVQGGGLVRGGAPLPEVHLNFLPDTPLHPATNAAGDDLEISLDSPGSGVFHFLFSPRPQLGFGYDRLTEVNRGYAGLTWSFFGNDRIFGNLALGGTYDPGSTTPFDALRRPLGAPLMMHGALEFGYQFGDQHSLSLRFDEGRSVDLRLNAESSDNLSLRYGMKF